MRFGYRLASCACDGPLGVRAAVQPASAAILHGQLICLSGEVGPGGSAEPDVDLWPVEPGHPRVNALLVEAAGEVLEVLAQTLSPCGALQYVTRMVSPRTRRSPPKAPKSSLRPRGRTHLLCLPPLPSTVLWPVILGAWGTRFALVATSEPLACGGGWMR